MTGQLPIACVQAGIPDQPGQPYREPDQAEARNQSKPRSSRPGDASAPEADGPAGAPLTATAGRNRSSRAPAGLPDPGPEVSDSLYLRRLCLLPLTQRAPDESTVRKLVRRLGPETVNELTR